MRRSHAGLAALAAIAATAAVTASAQDRGRDGADRPFRSDRGPREFSAQDREAFAEARIAAVKAGLRLTPDQEKMWPPVEEAMRGLARQRAEARQARRERWASFREGRDVDMPDQLRFMADRQTASGEALRKLADASAPLYRSLDENQKRRLGMLTRFGGPDRHMHGRGGWRDGALGQGPGGRGFAAEERGRFER